jgi:hypothetical protein
VTARSRMPVLLVIALIGASLCAGPLHAQRRRPLVPDLRNSPYLGVGYVANIPEAFTGAAVFVLTPSILGGAGLYADFKITPSTPTKAMAQGQRLYDPTITVQQADGFGDFLFDQKSTWLSINVALVYAVIPEFAVYGGMGYAKENHYREYYDDAENRGVFGFYWIPDPAASGQRLNVMGGTLSRLTKYVVAELGLESQPFGVTGGVILTLPW